MNISIIGSGKMATGIGTRLVSGGYSLTIYDRTLQKAKSLAKKLGENVKAQDLNVDIDGEIVIFALPYKSIFDVIANNKSKLDGKILVDISNPIDFENFKLIPPPDSSGSSEIAKVLPKGTILLKAFNTTFAGSLIEGRVEDKKLDVFIAGDDKDAKDKLKAVIEKSGMRALDAGPLTNAHALEVFQLMHMSMQGELGNTWMSAIKILP